MSAPICPQPLDVSACAFCEAPKPAYSLLLMRPKSERSEDADSVGLRVCAKCATERGAEVLRTAVDTLHAVADSKGTA